MIHATWPRSRARLMSRVLRLSDALRTVVEERDRLREELRLTREARAGDHAEILRLADALSETKRDRALAQATILRLREESLERQPAAPTDCRFHEEILRLHGLVAELGRLAADPTDCRFQLHSRDEHRLLHEQADIIARQQREIGQLEATIVRMRPRLMRKDSKESEEW